MKLTRILLALGMAIGLAIGFAIACRPQESTGWLCCDLPLNTCAPQGEDDCPTGTIQYWCDYYEQSPDGALECWDEWGQG